MNCDTDNNIFMSRRRFKGSTCKMQSEMKDNIENNSDDGHQYTINMDSCRICLKTFSSMCTLFERVRSISYAEMLRCVTKIKVFQDEDLPYKMCIKCRAALEKAFIFKVLAEKSHARLKLLKELDHDFSMTSVKKEYSHNEEYENDEYSDDYLEGQVLKEEGDSTDNAYVNEEDFGDITENEKIDYDGNFYISDTNEIELEEDDLNSALSGNSRYGIKNTKKETNCKERKDKTRTRSKKSNQQERNKDICPICGLLVAYLSQHMQTHNEQVLQCPECPKTFHKRRNLRCHLKYHRGTKNYVCSECDMSFYERRALNRHSSVHTGVKPYVCELCAKTFIAANTLKLHMEIHAGTKRYKCESCGAHFRAPHQLKAHSIQHTGEKPYYCQICNMKFSYKINLNRHVLKVHRVNLKFKSIKTFTQEQLMDANVEIQPELQPDENKHNDKGDFQTIYIQNKREKTKMKQNEIDQTIVNQEEIDQTIMKQEEIDQMIRGQDKIQQVIICVNGETRVSTEKQVLSMLL